MTSKIECRDLWKLFGVRCSEAMTAMRESDISKNEVRERYGCIAAVVGVNFKVEDGEIFCIMGLSGSGKSTVVRNINRLVEPTSGKVFIDGEDVGKFSAPELRQLRATKIGMVFQDKGLLPHRTVRDNVSFALELRGVNKERRDEVAEQVLELVQLAGWGDLMPDELSGGMQQRVGIARALAANPDILLMDEPFSALDPLIRRELQQQFLELSSVLKKTTIFITHDLEEAIRLGSRIAIMNEGKIVQTGTPEEIITRPANDYVADFVRDISRLKVVKARSIMEPLATYRSQNIGPPVDQLPKASSDSDLSELIDFIAREGAPVAIVEDHEPIGVVTLTSLLLGIKGAPTNGEENNV